MERFSLRFFLFSALSFLVIGFFFELFPIPNLITISRYLKHGWNFRSAMRSHSYKVYMFNLVSGVIWKALTKLRQSCILSQKWTQLRWKRAWMHRPKVQVWGSFLWLMTNYGFAHQREVINLNTLGLEKVLRSWPKRKQIFAVAFLRFAKEYLFVSNAVRNIANLNQRSPTEQKLNV